MEVKDGKEKSFEIPFCDDSIALFFNMLLAIYNCPSNQTGENRKVLV